MIMQNITGLSRFDGDALISPTSSTLTKCKHHLMTATGLKGNWELKIETLPHYNNPLPEMFTV